jgi:magnesium and cobalt exporter, CNNM family
VPSGILTVPELESASPPLELVLSLLPALVPAALVSVFGAASAAMGSLSGSRRAALRETLEGKSRAALERYIEHGPNLESRWLVMRVLGISISAALVVLRFGAHFGSWAPAVAGLVAVLAYGVPAEILKGVALRAPERSAVLLSRLLRPIDLLAAPFAAPMALVGRLVGRKVVTQPLTIPPPRVTETEVGILVNAGELDGTLDHEQSEMIRNVLEFRDLTAGEAMVPRTRVTVIDVNTPPHELLLRILDSGHSRYPVYRDRVDNVIGVLHAKDLLEYAASHEKLATLDLENILRRPVAFVPETQTASNVLRDMRAGRHHLAIVIDEFGGMSGIVTLEDLVEEIVGDIQDEHDVEEPGIVDLEDGRFLVDASVPIAELSRHLGEEFPEDPDYNTVGGFLMARLGRIPAAGAKLSARGFVFRVKSADERRVSKVEIERGGKSDSESPSKTTRVSAA